MAGETTTTTTPTGARIAARHLPPEQVQRQTTRETTENIFTSKPLHVSTALPCFTRLVLIFPVSPAANFRFGTT